MLGARTEALRSQHPRHARSGNGAFSNVRDVTAFAVLERSNRRRLRVRAELTAARMLCSNLRAVTKSLSARCAFRCCPADGRPDSGDGGRSGRRFVTPPPHLARPEFRGLFSGSSSSSGLLLAGAHVAGRVESDVPPPGAEARLVLSAYVGREVRDFHGDPGFYLHSDGRWRRRTDSTERFRSWLR
jgi:hypothetical protein